MSYFGNSTQFFPNNNKTQIIQNKQLLNNPINYIYPNITSQSVILNKGNLINEFNAYNNINKSHNTFFAHNRPSSFDANMNGSKLNLSKKNLISSGKLKISKRDKKYNRVIKNGRKLKNIDINRDYDEEPENDDVSSINSTTNIFKNKLATKAQNDYLNKNASEQSLLNNNINNINNSANLENNVSSIQQKSIIKSIRSENNLDEKSKASSHKSNKNQPEINKANPQYFIQKENNINLISNKSKPLILQNNLQNSEIYNINLGSTQEINQNIIYQEDNNINNITPNINNITPNINNITPTENLNEYIKNETLPQPFYQGDMDYHKHGKGFRYWSKLSKAGADINGNEKTNQDTPLAYISVDNIEGFNIFGVLDGHGNNGHFVSQFCRDYFMNKMKSYTESIISITQQITAEDIYINLKEDNFSYIKGLFLNADNELRNQSNFDCNLSGTTCNLIFQFNNHLVGFNVGDSRSILIEDSGDYTNKIIHPLSVDHKPDLPEELKRICSSGGAVDKIQDLYGNKLGPNRVFKVGCVYPGLAMSRSLGDFQAKECGVISEPQITEYEINENTKYFVVCSDGIWEFLWNEQVRDIGNSFYYSNNVAGFCKELVNIAVNVWGEKDKSRDDITVIAVFF